MNTVYTLNNTGSPFSLRSKVDPQKKESDQGSGSNCYGSFKTVRNLTENKINTQPTDVIKPVPLAVGMALLITFTSIL